MARPLHRCAHKVLHPSLQKRGFEVGQIITLWPEIVGAKLARASKPVSIKWHNTSSGPKDQQVSTMSVGTLIIGCAAAAAPILQHQNLKIISEINGIFGYSAIGAVKLKAMDSVGQSRRPVRKKRAAPAPIDLKNGANIENDGLRASLERLGAEVKRSKD